jgi:hypothetical protein
LRERDAHEPAAAFTCAARERDHGAERHQVAGEVVDRGHRVELRAGFLSREQLALPVGDAAHRLDDGIEAAARCPRSFMTESAERDADDAGP